MEKRSSWPWKKKSSEKTGSSKDQDDTKAVKYVQVPEESYANLSELAGQVEGLNAKISGLNDKLSSTQSELSSVKSELSSVQSELSSTQSEFYSLQDELTSAETEMKNKDVLVKQHAKVAEDAVSGWEKAEAEALSLKHDLESVTMQKLSAEHRISQLENALKECLKQVRDVKEESEEKLHDVIFAKTKQWESVKTQLEARLADFEQELMRASADNNVLSRSLQERSHALMKVNDEKSQTEAEIEVLKDGLQTCEREISSLKYEIHVVSKELEIRNEEKNMIQKSAEVANKQHVEDVKKVTKLEAECQRLRALVRKKLPGPAALAQMKLEVENLGREYGETKQKRSPAKSSSPHHASSPSSDFALENMQQCRKENEFLTARLLAMEEEMKMLKEALAKRNSELQASRDMCAKTASKLHVYVMNQQKESDSDKLDVMNDFLEMEKLANENVPDKNDSPASNIQSKIASLFESGPNDCDMQKLLKDIHQILHDAQQDMQHHSVKRVVDETDSVSDTCMEKECQEEMNTSKPNTDHVMNQQLKDAISQILRFVSSFGKVTVTEKLDQVLRNEVNLEDFVITLSHLLSTDEGEIYGSDCIDKVALLENNAKEISAVEAPLNVVIDPKNFEQLKLEKENMEIELAACRENLELMKLQLVNLESQLSASENSNSLALTQLKCMAESYKSLESRKDELENEVSMLSAKEELLVNELQQEKLSHRVDLEKYKELQEQIERNGTIISDDADVGTKTKQELEIAAAAEKLAECQETIFLLSKHLSSLRSPANSSDASL